MNNLSKNRFKGSKVQMFKVFGVLIFSVLELLNPLNVEQTFAQSEFLSRKDRSHHRRSDAGRLLRSLGAAARPFHAALYSGQSQLHRAEYAGGEFDDRDEPCVRRSQARRTHPRHAELRRLSRPARRAAKKSSFDVTKIHFIGSPEKSDIVLYARADAPFKTVQDMRKLAEPAKCGATGTAGADYLIARVLDDTLGVKINSITGYAGGSEIDMAVEKGEVMCRGMTIAPHFGREPFDSWHKKGFDQHIVQTSEKRDSRIAEVPTLYEIFDKENTPDESRRVADVILRGGDFGRPMFVGPGTPADRVNILREAYVKSMSNPELIAEAKKARMDMEPVTGEQLQALAKRVMNQPPAVIKRVRKILE